MTLGELRLDAQFELFEPNHSDGAGRLDGDNVAVLPHVYARCARPSPKSLGKVAVGGAEADPGAVFPTPFLEVNPLQEVHRGSRSA